MILLDTDTITLLAAGQARVVAKFLSSTEPVATTIITRIEVLRGRFDFLLKAADGEQLQRAQHWLIQSERDLSRFGCLPVSAASAAEFDRLRSQKKLVKIGRSDLLIASIALAQQATLVTRNVRHFRQVPELKVENWADES